jgi:sugar/nucleoside kinase (ribokinase family)
VARQVLVLGDALLDVHVTPARPMRPGADVPALIRLEPGGQGANLAVRLARRGVDVLLRCGLGTDAAGGLVRSALAANGVVLDAIESPATGSVVVLVDRGGRRTMLSQRAPLTGPSLAAGGAGWLVVSGYALLEPDADQLATLPLSDRRAVIGCALDDAEVEGWRTALKALEPNLLVLNEDEAALVSGGAPEPAPALANELDAVVVVTRAGGATARLGGETLQVTRGTVATVDTTGAGDAFAAALIAELLDVTWPPPRDALERALLTASSAATAVTLVPGAQARVDGER